MNILTLLQSIGLHDAAGTLASNVRTSFDAASEQALSDHLGPHMTTRPGPQVLPPAPAAVFLLFLDLSHIETGCSRLPVPAQHANVIC
jgi:hypothetical protein